MGVGKHVHFLLYGGLTFYVLCSVKKLSRTAMLCCIGC
jgi:hypothetical protein